MAWLERVALWLIVVFACIFAYCEHGKHEHRLWRLESEMDRAAREDGWQNYIDSTYWKPKTWKLIEHHKLEGPGEYGKRVDEAGTYWFPEGWEEKDRERRTLALEY